MRIHGFFQSLAVGAALIGAPTAFAGPNEPASSPLFVSESAPALNMLVMGRDHKLYYEAYNDAADLDNPADGVIDVGFKPSIDYYGYFNSSACYTYQNNRFEPTAAAGLGHTCTGAWSGNFLNYLATSRMDALRKVLYGGYRVTDSTTETVLRAAFIPQDAHSWGKEHSTNIFYSIEDYTPLSEPAEGYRHLFAVTTLADNGIPQLRVLTNTTFRIWNWVSIERPVAGNDCFDSSNNRVSCTSGGATSSGWEIVPAARFSNLTYTTWADSGGSPNNSGEMDGRFSGHTSTLPSTDMCTNGPVSVTSIDSGSDINVPIKSPTPSGCSQDQYHTLITGTFRVAQSGTYEFAIAGDDAIDIKIGSTIVASHYGAHGADTSDDGLNSHQGSILLNAGTDYTIQVRQKEDFGGSNWFLYWKPLGSGGASVMTDYALDILACPASSAALREDICVAYPGNGTALYKPTGLLHDFGATNQMYFGLLTGSYGNNLYGGVLRSNIESFTREVNATTGQFTAVDGIVSTINKLRVTGFDYGSHAYDSCGWITDGPITGSGYAAGRCAMWGNPIGEMMYETLRYFGGATAGRTEYTNNTANDGLAPLQLAAPTWKPPYATIASGGAGYRQCSLPVMTVISDINPSYDYKLPRSAWTSEISSSGDPVTMTSLDVSSETDAIGAAEGLEGKTVFIGESNGTANSAPTPKLINKFSTLRGLAPEEPSKQGTYYSAGVARYGANNAIGGGNSVLTYAVALASPLPKIVFPIGGNKVTVVPFAKSVGGGGVSGTGNFQPTDQIVDYYVTKIANTGPTDTDLTVNGGWPYAEFSINYEDVEQGADHDMDAIARYSLSVTPLGLLQVQLTSEYAAGGIDQYMGYVISGTTQDGVYLEIKDLDGADVAYRLNTPPGRLPGYCDTSPMPSDCTGLPFATSRTFMPSATAGASLLNDPLWYAAKYGKPNRDPSSVTGTPDNYFLVTNALTLKASLTNAFNGIRQYAESVTSPAVVPILNADAQDAGRSIYRTSYKVATWSGDIIKETTTTTTSGWTASAAMPSAASRVIKMASTNSSNPSGLVNFTWDNVRALGTDGVYGGVNLQQALAVDPDNASVLPPLNADGTLADADDITAGQKRLDFIKGTDTSYRPRDSLLGDIINSSPVVVEGAQYLAYLADKIDGTTGTYAAFINAQKTRAGRIYVGANDGMLHGFDTTTGAETFAFVPSAVIRNLSILTSKDYNQTGGRHFFYVDGTPVVRDVYINNEWRTVLVGTLRAGGKSLFALDVTDPAAIKLLWEFSEGDDLTDAEKGSTPSDMGYSFPKPTLARLHSGQWAVVTGNGYDSASGRAALMLIDIATGELIRKLPVATTGNNAINNGLSSVRVADNNSDGFADYVYAGDLQGNLWRFDLINTARTNPLTPAPTADSASTFKVSFGGVPLYVALDQSSPSKRQPITAPPSLVRHPSTVGYIVMFGTGRYFTQSDKNSTELQTLYGIWDRQTRGEAAATTPTLDRDDLQQQQFVLQTTQTFSGDELKLRVLSNDPVEWYDGTSGSYGWYLDLAVLANGDLVPEGERVVDEMARLGQVLLLGTRTPDADSCKAGLKGFTYGIDPFTGGRTRFNVFDLDKNGVINVEDSIKVGANGNIQMTPSGIETPPGGFTTSGGRMYFTDGTSRDLDVGPGSTYRQSWQVVPNN